MYNNYGSVSTDTVYVVYQAFCLYDKIQCMLHMQRQLHVHVYMLVVIAESMGKSLKYIHVRICNEVFCCTCECKADVRIFMFSAGTRVHGMHFAP